MGTWARFTGPQDDPAIVQGKLDDLHAMFADDGVDGILATIGGLGACQLLDDLDYDLVAAHPKPFVGYSDTTALLVAIWRHTGLVTFHGPALLPQFGEWDGCDPYTWRSLLEVTTRTDAPYELAMTDQWIVERLPWDGDDRRPRRRAAAPRPRAMRSGRAEGPLVALNVATALELATTIHFPDLRGCIACFEETEGVSTTEVLDHLQALESLGVFDDVVAIAWGRFSPITEPIDEDEFCAALLGASARRQSPVVIDVPFGHADPILTLPIGARARIDAGPHVCLELLEPAVA